MNTLSIPQAAAMLNIHPKTAEKLARDGVLPAAKIGRAYLILEDDLNAFVLKRIKEQTADRRKHSA